MAVTERRNVPWTRKHDDPKVPHKPTVARIAFPSSLSELIEVCADPTAGALKASGSHWGLSEAAVSDHTFIESHDPTGSVAAMGRTLFEVVPECMTNEAIVAFKNQRPTAFDDDPTVNKGTYLAHFETGKRVYQLYAELDLGDDNNPRSLAREISDRRGGDKRLFGPWGIHTMGGAGGQTVFGALTTGTHGGDIALPPIADMVQALHLVSHGGRHFWIERERLFEIEGAKVSLFDDASLRKLYGRADLGGPGNFEIIRDTDLFHAVLMGAGRFGAVYSVVMRAVRQYCLHEDRELVSWEGIRSQVNDPTSDLFTRKFGKIDQKFLQIAVCTTPGKNFSAHLCGVTRRWNSMLWTAGGPFAPNGRVERCGMVTDPADPIFNAPRFSAAGASFTYNPDPAQPNRALSPNFLELACTSDDLLAGTIDKVIADTNTFVTTNQVVVGSTLAAVVGLGVAPVLLLLLGPLVPLIAALVALVAAFRAASGPVHLGQGLDLVRDVLLGGAKTPAERTAGIFLWQALVNELFGGRQGPLAFTAISYAVMDRHNYMDRSCEVHAESMEVFFDSTDSSLIAFVDAVLDFEMRQENMGRAFAGWLSLRFMSKTEALIGMQQFDRTCAVEIAGMLAVSGTIELIRFAETLAVSLGAHVHWGQRNNLTQVQLQSRFGDRPGLPLGAQDHMPLTRWRKALARLTDNGARAAFSSAFTRRIGLEVVQPEISQFELLAPTFAAGSGIGVRWDCRRNPAGVRLKVELWRLADGKLLVQRSTTRLQGSTTLDAQPQGNYQVRLTVTRTLNRQSRTAVQNVPVAVH